MRTRIYLIATLVLFTVSCIIPFFGHTYMALATFFFGFGSSCAYLARVEDAIKVYGRPVFW